MKARTGWEKMIATKTYGLIDPDPYVVEKLRIVKQWGIRKVLDLGCGQGRHTILLSKEQFEVSALDISPSAVATTKKSLEENSVPGTVSVGTMENLPYPAGYFDMVLAWRVLYLGKIEFVRKAFSEVKRILRPGGILYASIRSVNNTLCHIGKQKGKEIESNTYVFNSDGLSDIVYHFFTDEETTCHCADLEIAEIGESELQHTEYTARYPEHKNLFWVVLARKPL